MSASSFLDRVFAHLPPVAGRFDFRAWSQPGRPTSEGVGVLPSSGIDVERLAARVLDFDHYVGNIDYVVECRTVPDAARAPAVRFYQRVKIPVLAEIHHELAMTDHGVRDGWRVLAWEQLDAETARLDAKKGARSDYNVGAWLLKADAVAYALSSAPRREDVGLLKFAALTKGADASAAKVVQANIEGMIRWSRR